MKRGLIAFIVLVGLLLGAGAPPAYPAELGHWKGCVAERAAAPSLSVCNPSSGEIDYLVDIDIRGQLHQPVNDVAALCRIDAAAVRAQRECSRSDGLTAIRLAHLMELLAANWTRQGSLERADQLYQRAYYLAVNAGVLGLWTKVDVLQGWAELKLAQRNPQQAREFAARQTAIIRDEYFSGRGYGSRLIDSLKFESRILLRTGAIQAALAALREADKLDPHSCLGGCDTLENFYVRERR